MNKRPDVVFVCVHNAGRSQMAKALFNAQSKELGLDLVADSAGTIPSENVHPVVVEVMSELGHDLSGESGKLLTDDMIAHQPAVITMGCAVDSQACPSLIMDDVVDWGLPDPKDQPIDMVRGVRDEIQQRVSELLDQMRADH